MHHLDAHDKDETLAAVLNGWADALALDYRVRPATAAAQFLTDHLRMIVKEDWAGDLAQELAEPLADCRRAIDRALEVISLGVCGHGGCPGTVTTIVGSSFGKCRECGAVWDVHERQQWMISQAWHAEGSLRLIVSALRASGQITMTYEALKKWGQRDKRYGHCDVASREHRYTAAGVLQSIMQPNAPNRRRITS